jgi:hypothetical protein
LEQHVIYYTAKSHCNGKQEVDAKRSTDSKKFSEEEVELAKCSTDSKKFSEEKVAKVKMEEVEAKCSTDSKKFSEEKFVEVKMEEVEAKCSTDSKKFAEQKFVEVKMEAVDAEGSTSIEFTEEKSAGLVTIQIKGQAARAALDVLLGTPGAPVPQDFSESNGGSSWLHFANHEEAEQAKSILSMKKFKVSRNKTKLDKTSKSRRRHWQRRYS